MGKRHLDEAAEQIIAKWTHRIGNGWKPSVSDILRHLDTLAEAKEREPRDSRRRA